MPSRPENKLLSTVHQNSCRISRRSDGHTSYSRANTGGKSMTSGLKVSFCTQPEQTPIIGRLWGQRRTRPGMDSQAMLAVFDPKTEDFVQHLSLGAHSNTCALRRFQFGVSAKYPRADYQQPTAKSGMPLQRESYFPHIISMSWPCVRPSLSASAAMASPTLGNTFGCS